MKIASTLKLVSFGHLLAPYYRHLLKDFIIRVYWPGLSRIRKTILDLKGYFRPFNLVSEKLKLGTVPYEGYDWPCIG